MSKGIAEEIAQELEENIITVRRVVNAALERAAQECEKPLPSECNDPDNRPDPRDVVAFLAREIRALKGDE